MELNKLDILASLSHEGVPKATLVQQVQDMLEVGANITTAKEEVPKLRELQSQLGPLYGQVLDLSERRSYLDSDIEMEVMLEYPPRKGSEAQREALRAKLRGENEEYLELQNQIQAKKQEIEDIKFDMTMVEQDAKNARRVIELATSYISTIGNY